MKLRLWIISHAYAGKTTAHRAGVVFDPEEGVPMYAEFRKGWGDPAKAGDPDWRRRQKEAYRTACRLALRGPQPIVVTHPPKDMRTVEQVAEETDRIPVIFILNRLEAEANIKSVGETGNEPWYAVRREAYSTARGTLRQWSQHADWSYPVCESWNHILDEEALARMDEIANYGDEEE